jgi:hypothetical protein
MGRDIPSTPTIVRHGTKEAVRFTTPAGVTAIVATSVDPELMRLLRKKLERKLRAKRCVNQGNR